MKIENIKGMIRVCMILLLSAFTAFAAKAQVGKDNPAQNTTMSKAPAVSSQNAAALRAALRSYEHTAFPYTKAAAVSGACGQASQGNRLIAHAGTKNGIAARRRSR
jgi:hypothetical protein